MTYAKTLALLVLLSCSGCRSLNNEAATIESEFKDIGFSCPVEGLALGGPKWQSFKDISRQCRLAGVEAGYGPVKLSTFLCACLAISADAENFSKNIASKTDSYSKTEANECLRHLSWQAQITCNYGPIAAKALGDIREQEALDAKRDLGDINRDLAHNYIGRYFMQLLKDDGLKTSLNRCRKVSHALASFAVQENSCVRIDEKRPSDSDLELSAKKFGQYQEDL
ncbi:hypothetical protein N9D31_01045 [Oligoflexaceae bacterium]|nr:hypothetical protein [Oligoflexaceae bacterium]